MLRVHTSSFAVNGPSALQGDHSHLYNTSSLNYYTVVWATLTRHKYDSLIRIGDEMLPWPDYLVLEDTDHNVTQSPYHIRRGYQYLISHTYDTLLPLVSFINTRIIISDKLSISLARSRSFIIKIGCNVATTFNYKASRSFLNNKWDIHVLSS